MQEIKLNRNQALAVSIAIGDFLARGLNQKSITPKDWEDWSLILDKFLKACDYPKTPEHFVIDLPIIIDKINNRENESKSENYPDSFNMGKN